MCRKIIALLVVWVVIVCGCRPRDAASPHLTTTKAPIVAEIPSAAVAKADRQSGTVEPAKASTPVVPGPIRFRAIAAPQGIDFLHTDGSTGKRYIIETVASGMATFDYDGDGLVDIYCCNGAPLSGTQ